ARSSTSPSRPGRMPRCAWAYPTAKTSRGSWTWDVNDGVRSVPLSEFAGLHLRICRPVGLAPGEVDAVAGFMLERRGHSYDLKNILDLARYLTRQPPVPDTFKRRMLALGSGEPTRAICSTLLAQAFGSIGYPILPGIEV